MSLTSWFTTASPTDPIALLKRDHDTFQELIDRINETTTRSRVTRARLFGQLKRLLSAHERIEETIFYPVLERHAKSKDIVLEGYQEHHVADLLTAEITRMAIDSEDWGPKAHVLGESLEHHIKEEEKKMFPQARRVLDAAQLAQLGARMAKRRQTLLEGPASSRPAPSKGSKEKVGSAGKAARTSSASAATRSTKSGRASQAQSAARK